MERFLVEICSPEWNHRQDAGRPWAEAIAELVARFPAERDRIVAYRERWVEMLGGVFDDTLAIVDELRASGAVRLFALTNWSAETYAIARDRFPFLAWFEAVVVSGELGIAKPDPAIFRYLLERHDLDARSTIYVDDLEPNVAAARRLGLRSVRFEDATTLRRRLVAEGVLEARRPA